MHDPTVEREMHELRDRLDAMEIAQRHTTDARDTSEVESENEVGKEGEEVAVKDAMDERLFGFARNPNKLFLWDGFYVSFSSFNRTFLMIKDLPPSTSCVSTFRP